MNIFIKSVDQVLDLTSKHFQKVSVFFYTLYFGVLSGLLFFNIDYLNAFKLLIHSFICIFLLVRFHPFREHFVNVYDARIIFASAIILLINTGIIEYINLKMIVYDIIAFDPNTINNDILY